MDQHLTGSQPSVEILRAGLRKEVAALASDRARREFLKRRADVMRAEIVSHLADSVPRLAKSDRTQALRVAEFAVMIAIRLQETESLAQSFRAKANALYAFGRNRQAIAHHRKAVELFRSSGNAEQVARTLSSSIQPLILQGRYDQAFAAAHEAREIFALQGNQWRLARVELNLGNIFDRQDRFAEALECYERAHEYLLLQEREDPEAVAVALHNIAVSYVSLNDLRRALTTYEQARSFAEAHDMPVLVGQADYNIAWLHYLRGDYNRAITMLRAARETCRSTSDDYHFALCHLDLSEVYLELNLTTEAAEAAEQAAVSFRELGMQYERAKSMTNFAIALGQQGNASAALELFQRARKVFVKEGNKVLPWVVDLYRAVVLVGESRDVEAKRLSIAALKAFQKAKLSNKAIVCRLLLARLHLRNKELPAAQQQCARALKTLARLDAPVLSCQANALMGQIQAMAGYEQRSYEAYQRARSLLERLRNSIHGEELKISFMKDRVEIYQALVGICMNRARRMPAIEEAFEYVQQAKSRSLLDALSTSRSTSWLAPQDETDHGRRIRELREELNWYFHKTEAAQLQQATQQELAKLRAESRWRERELLKLLREYSPSDDSVSRLPFTATRSIAQVRNALPENATILEYFQVQDKIVMILLSKGRLEMVTLADTSHISHLLELLTFQLSKLRLGADYVRSFASMLLQSTRAHLRQLYEALIAPIRHRLTGGHLIIAPHGMLHHLPFQALHDGEQYLIDEFTITFAPSASIYALCQTRSSIERSNSLILGIPDEAVPFVREEVQAVAACLPQPELFLGESAKAEILRQKGQTSRFIHIATHGYFRQDNAMFSGIRMGDSYLSLYDLYQLKLPAELVTLSGCSTGLNVVAAGDELLGLARGLIHAGAETSLLTLWDVQDHSSAKLMKCFYSYLASGKNKSQALQEAMKQVKAEYPHPYYWAPFVLVGKG